MFCLIALIVFSILGIFSATHRKLAKEAFDCVFRRITLRPCNTGFDQKIKGKIIGKLLNKSPKLAKGVQSLHELFDTDDNDQLNTIAEYCKRILSLFRT